MTPQSVTPNPALMFSLRQLESLATMFDLFVRHHLGDPSLLPQERKMIRGIVRGNSILPPPHLPPQRSFILTRLEDAKKTEGLHASAPSALGRVLGSGAHTLIMI